MYQFEYSIIIDRSPQEVFAFVTDLNNLPKWQGGRETFQWITEGPPGVGSRYNVQVTILGARSMGKWRSRTGNFLANILSEDPVDQLHQSTRENSKRREKARY